MRNNLIRAGESLALSVSLPEAGVLSARVFDARGRVIAVLHQGPAGPGELELRWSAESAASGAYTVVLQCGSQSARVHTIVAR